MAKNEKELRKPDEKANEKPVEKADEKAGETNREPEELSDEELGQAAGGMAIGILTCYTGRGK